MKKTPTERQQAELARRKAMGVAKYISPLRHVLKKHSHVEKDVKGMPHIVYDYVALDAIWAAKKGLGQVVQRLAMEY